VNKQKKPKLQKEQVGQARAT